jgi:surface protein
MFQNCSSLTTIPQLDTSNVTNMQNMFYYCEKLTTIPQLYTSKVTKTINMFAYCKALTTIPQLDTSRVTSMNYMFQDCYKLEKVDISYYKISSTSSSSDIFTNCYVLKAVIIRGFGTSYTLKSNAFSNCYHLTGTVNETYNPNGDKDCYIYVPSTMVDTLKSATNWSAYADQIRALEDYTVDGTVNGELDESKVNA